MAPHRVMTHETSMRAAQDGKHMFFEKTMITAVADCEAMIDVCEKAKQKLMSENRNQLEPTKLAATIRK